jgi:hypothetical protein
MLTFLRSSEMKSFICFSHFDAAWAAFYVVCEMYLQIAFLSMVHLRIAVAEVERDSL